MSPFDEIWLDTLMETVVIRFYRDDSDNFQESSGWAVRLRERVDEAAAEPGGGLDPEADPIRGFDDLGPAFRLTPRVLAFCRCGVPAATTGAGRRRNSGS